LAKSGAKSVHLEVPGSIEKGAELPGDNNAGYQLLLSDYFKKVPGSIEKGAELLARKSFNLITILSLTTEPVKIEKLM